MWNLISSFNEFKYDFSSVTTQYTMHRMVSYIHTFPYAYNDMLNSYVFANNTKIS